MYATSEYCSFAGSQASHLQLQAGAPSDPVRLSGRQQHVPAPNSFQIPPYLRRPRAALFLGERVYLVFSSLRMLRLETVVHCPERLMSFGPCFRIVNVPSGFGVIIGLSFDAFCAAHAVTKARTKNSLTAYRSLPPSTSASLTAVSTGDNAAATYPRASQHGRCVR